MPSPNRIRNMRLKMRNSAPETTARTVDDTLREINWDAEVAALARRVEARENNRAPDWSDPEVWAEYVKTEFRA